jgi:hypothetical protein
MTKRGRVGCRLQARGTTPLSLDLPLFIVQPLLLLESPCRLRQPRIFWGRIRLYPEWLLITGIGWHGRYRRRLSLKDIDEIQLSSLYGTAPGMTLTLCDGHTLEVTMKGGMLWRLQIEEARRALSQETAEDVSAARVRLPEADVEEPVAAVALAVPLAVPEIHLPPKPAWLDLLDLMQAENDLYEQSIPDKPRKKAGARPRRKKDNTEPTADP